MVIGLCGGSGSGKGAVSFELTKYNALHIDTDNLYHNMTSAPSECLRELVLNFGEGILSDGGSLNRRALSDIVFSGNDSREKLKALNQITHKHILNKVREIISDENNKEYSFFIVDAPLLFESGFDKECDLIIAVVCDKETRIQRIIERDKISYERAKGRIDSQIDDEELKNKADIVIENTGSIDSLREKIKLLVNNYLIKEK